MSNSVFQSFVKNIRPSENRTYDFLLKQKCMIWNVKVELKFFFLKFFITQRIRYYDFLFSQWKPSIMNKQLFATFLTISISHKNVED